MYTTEFSYVEPRFSRRLLDWSGINSIGFLCNSLIDNKYLIFLKVVFCRDLFTYPLGEFIAFMNGISLAGNILQLVPS